MDMAREQRDRRARNMEGAGHRASHLTVGSTRAIIAILIVLAVGLLLVFLFEHIF
jgi:hypothetical protein